MSRERRLLSFTSTFEYFPGVPIYHSKNLVNWELVNYCLTADEQLYLQNARASAGIYAATIRFHDGTFDSFALSCL